MSAELAVPTVFEVAHAFAYASVKALKQAELACTFPGSKSTACKLSDVQVGDIQRAQVSAFSKGFATAQGKCACGIKTSQVSRALLPDMVQEAVALYEESCRTGAHPRPQQAFARCALPMYILFHVSCDGQLSVPGVHTVSSKQLSMFLINCHAVYLPVRPY